MDLQELTLPLCLSCRVSLEQKTEIDEVSGDILEIHYCPNCEEIFFKKKKQTLP